MNANRNTTNNKDVKKENKINLFEINYINKKNQENKSILNIRANDKKLNKKGNNSDNNNNTKAKR